MGPLSPFSLTSFKTCLKTPFPHKALPDMIRKSCPFIILCMPLIYPLNMLFASVQRLPSSQTLTFLKGKDRETFLVST